MAYPISAIQVYQEFGSAVFERLLQSIFAMFCVQHPEYITKKRQKTSRQTGRSLDKWHKLTHESKRKIAMISFWSFKQFFLYFFICFTYVFISCQWQLSSSLGQIPVGTPRVILKNPQEISVLGDQKGRQMIVGLGIIQEMGVYKLT